jgi:tetratricopeptide (TPR) repeat protein
MPKAYSSFTKMTIFLIVCAVLTSCANSLSNVELKKGNNYANQGQYQKAINQYTEAIERADGDSERCLAYSNRGHTYLVELGEIQKGMNDLTTAINLRESFNKFNSKNNTVTVLHDEPGKMQDYSDRAYGYICIEQYLKAISDSSKAINTKIHTTSWLAYPYCIRGYAYDALKQPQQATNDYKKATELCSNLGESLYQRATRYENLGKKDLAATCKELAKHLGYLPSKQ